MVDFKCSRLSSHIYSEALPFKKKESKEDSQFTYWDKAFEKISNTYFRKEAGHSITKGLSENTYDRSNPFHKKQIRHPSSLWVISNGEGQEDINLKYLVRKLATQKMSSKWKEGSL